MKFVNKIFNNNFGSSKLVSLYKMYNLKFNYSLNLSIKMYNKKFKNKH